MPSIRLATLADAAAIQAIYAPIVRDTIISFELVPPNVDEIRGRITKVLARYPWLVYARDSKVLGYAYASQHHDRAAYDWSADISIYVSARARRMGLGRALYQSLFALLRAQNVVNVYAGVSLPNAGSVGLHEAMGMTPVGVYRQVGYKFGAWHDVGWWEMALGERPAVPAAMLSGDEAHRVWASLLHSADEVTI